MRRPHRRNRDLAPNKNERQPRSDVTDRAGSLALVGAGTRLEQDGQTVVDDINLLATELARQGFVTFSFGRGPLIDEKDARVIDEFAIKHPDGLVVTATSYKFLNELGINMKSYFFLEERTPEGYQEHVAEWQINADSDTPLSELMVEI